MDANNQPVSCPIDGIKQGIPAFVAGLVLGALLIGLFVGIAKIKHLRIGFYGIPPNAVYAR